jgi:hypothetical protein
MANAIKRTRTEVGAHPLNSKKDPRLGRLNKRKRCRDVGTSSSSALLVVLATHISEATEKRGVHRESD